MGIRELTRRVEALEALLRGGSRDTNSALPAYRLLRPIPGCAAGTVFVHDVTDNVFGSPAQGSMRNAWENGNCQATSPWCAGTHTLPGQMAENTEWFKRLPNDGRFYVTKPGKRP